MSVLDDPREDGLQQSWSDMTTRRLPDFAKQRGWPAGDRAYFERILLDAVRVDTVFVDARNPAHADNAAELLEDAIALGEAVIEGSADLASLHPLLAQMRA